MRKAPSHTRKAALVPFGAHRAEVERIRHALPISQYLQVLHQGAVTGLLPRLDREGNATGDAPLTEKERIDLLKFLVNKSMPDRAPEPETLTAKLEDVTTSDNIAEARLVQADAVESWTDEELRDVVGR